MDKTFEPAEVCIETTCKPCTTRLHVVQIHPTLQCNLRCKHCYSSSGPQLRGALHPDDLALFLQYAGIYGFNVMSVSGGEPFIYPHLEQLLVTSHALGYKNMAASNGMLFKTDRAQRCLDNLDLIAISIDGDEPMHDEIRNFPGAFRKMLEGVDQVRQKGIPFGFIHTLTDKSWEKLIWLAGFAYQQGARLLQLHPLELTGRAIIEFNHLLPTQETLHKVYIISSFLQQQYAGVMHIHRDFFHRNLILDTPASVSYYGDDFEITEINFAEVLRSLIVDQNGNVFPLSYGFSDHFLIGNIRAVKEGKDIFRDFLQQKADALYDLFRQTYRDIESDTENDMVAWTEMIVKQGNKQAVAQPQL